MNSHDSSREPNALERPLFEEMSRVQKLIITILSLSFEPLNGGVIQRACMALKLRVTAGDLRTALRLLVDQEWLREELEGYRLKDESSDDVKTTLSPTRWRGIIPALRKEAPLHLHQLRSADPSTQEVTLRRLIRDLVWTLLSGEIKTTLSLLEAALSITPLPLAQLLVEIDQSFTQLHHLLEITRLDSSDDSLWREMVSVAERGHRPLSAISASLEAYPQGEKASFYSLDSSELSRWDGDHLLPTAQKLNGAVGTLKGYIAKSEYERLKPLKRLRVLLRDLELLNGMQEALLHEDCDFVFAHTGGFEVLSSREVIELRIRAPLFLIMRVGAWLCKGEAEFALTLWKLSEAESDLMAFSSMWRGPHFIYLFPIFAAIACYEHQNASTSLKLIESLWSAPSDRRHQFAKNKKTYVQSNQPPQGPAKASSCLFQPLRSLSAQDFTLMRWLIDQHIKTTEARPTPPPFIWDPETHSSTQIWLTALMLNWGEARLNERALSEAKSLLTLCSLNRMRALYKALNGLLNPTPRSKNQSAGVEAEISPPQPWERTLCLLNEAVETFSHSTSTSQMLSNTEEREDQRRAVWVIDQALLELEMRVQVYRMKGWTKGRTISLKRLFERPSDFPFLTDADRAITQFITPFQIEYSSAPSYALALADTLDALRRHPWVFYEDTSRHISVVKRLPQLNLERIDDSINGTLDLHIRADGKVSPLRVCSTMDSQREELRYCELLPTFEAVSLSLCQGVSFPFDERERFFPLLQKLSRFGALELSLNGIEAQEFEEEGDYQYIDANVNLIISCRPRTTSSSDWKAYNSYQFKISVDPFLGEDFYEGSDLDDLSSYKRDRFPPGKGDETLITRNAEGGALYVTRDLKAEERRLQSLILDVPVFLNPWRDRPEAVIPLSLEDSLTLLQILGALSSPPMIEWPEGGELIVSETLGHESMTLTVKGASGHLSLQGELHVRHSEESEYITAEEEPQTLGKSAQDKHTGEPLNSILSLDQISTLMDESPGRYLQLAPRRFIALTDRFYDQLSALLKVTDQGKAPKYAAPLIQALEDEDLRVVATRAWKQKANQMKRASVMTPTIPSALNGTLRDYQHQGYLWLMRLAEWTSGGCLADDMGLGKTIQAISFLLSRANQGPALIIAPTSVCGAWRGELEKFSPSLKRIELTTEVTSGHRASLLERILNASQGEVVLCSYGLLNRELSSMRAVEWSTVIFDEAQALKNRKTLRYEAASVLKSSFILMMTGTPVENSLSDLWSLLNLAAPKLLGDHRSFRKRIADPIEKEADELARSALTQITSPFLLRRLKSEVLTELPPKVEVNVPITLGEEEAAHYEALRQRALDAARAHQNSLIHILAEITRLRLACSHPRLVNETWTRGAAKMERLRAIVRELKAGGHKALIFSQFTATLEIVATWMNEEGLNYHRLEGSTSVRQRNLAVKRFMEGEGDFFLISLKAGGSGLTLTEADYVIHLDPWWNPAVEDQASDRAHRIGQSRTVTVYRLITQGTIETQLVRLHKEKRALASVVTEAGMSGGQLSAEEWISLLESV